MLAAASVATAERFFHVFTREPALNVFQGCVHLG
jgi:hypothetical protein